MDKEISNIDRHLFFGVIECQETKDGMMAKNNRNYEKSDHEKLKDTNDKLKAQVRKLTKENARLKSELRTLESAWGKTSNYLKSLTEDRSLSELIQDADCERPFKKERSNECPMCHSNVKPIIGVNFKVINCVKCGFRKKVINESLQEQNEDQDE